MSVPDPLDTARRMWTIGSYAAVGDLFAAAGEDLVSTVGVEGLEVLDVACGTGNTSLAAVRHGATRVVGVDLTPPLLAEAADRARAAGVEARVEWREGDMAKLPVADASFDRVLSTFGAMFATDQRRVAGELRRACRPGGLIGVTAWSVDSLFDRMTNLLLGFLPQAPPPGPGPRDWAQAELLPAIFDVEPGALRVEQHRVTWLAPSAETAVGLLEEASGPVMLLRDALATGWPEARAALVDLFTAVSRPAGAGALALDLGYTMTVLGRS